MSRPIFLCYRRTDSSVTGRVRDAIRYRFGDESVYMDTSASAAGERWPTALENAIDDADVVIVVISPNWITQGDEWGRRRIDQAGDWVRREIELALTAQKPIVPLLVGEARMPPKEAFPVEIAGLTEWQGRRLNDESWDHLIEPLLDELASLTSQSVGSSTAPPRHAGQDGRRSGRSSRSSRPASTTLRWTSELPRPRRSRASGACSSSTTCSDSQARGCPRSASARLSPSPPTSGRPSNSVVTRASSPRSARC